MKPKLFTTHYKYVFSYYDFNYGLCLALFARGAKADISACGTKRVNTRTEAVLKNVFFCCEHE
jgi:hypothetical protein